MELKRGYSLEVIKENINRLSREIDEEAAMAIAVSYARNLFKRERPDSASFPEHLKPGQFKKHLRGEQDGRG